ncbi:PHD finger protein EHD3 isoform C [Glycine soja]|uniref:PHD finger protein EHD3 isoform C n=1 Tax=Glycine soja TaxID=3848 RepID=A0A445H686_GLYSO|nr:PHD finger protein EHD3 isoform C [Glycine soja]
MTGEIEQNGCISKKQRRIRKPASSSSAAAAAAASTSQQIFQHTLSFLQFPLRKATFSNLSFLLLWLKLVRDESWGILDLFAVKP